MIQIAVTGGSGYLGATLMPFLHRSGYRVDIFDVRPPRYTLPSALFRYIKKDLSEKGSASVEELRPYDFIIHLAGLVGFPACSQNPKLAVASNLKTTENLLRTKRKDAHLLLASTVSNYGSEMPKVDEKTPLQALTLYTETKIAAEKLVGSDPLSTIYRFSSSFGVSPVMRDDLIVHDFVKKAVNGETLSIYEGHYPRSLVHVRDIARSIQFFVDNAIQMGGEIYNIGNPEAQVTKVQLARLLQKFLLLTYKEDNSQSDPEKRKFSVSFEKIMKLGFQPHFSLEQSIPEIINYYAYAAQKAVKQAAA